MKKTCLFTILIMSLISSLFSIRNWKSYNNTSHIFDVIERDGEIMIASWGGLMIYNSELNTFEKHYTTIDGLGSNYIRTLDYLEKIDELWLGTANAGIDRIKNENILNSINEGNILNSNSINKIIHKDSLIFIANKKGVSSFVTTNDWPLPILKINFEAPDYFANGNIQNMVLTQNNYLIMNDEQGLYSVHIDSMQAITNWNFFNTEGNILSISSNENTIAIGTTKGLIVTDNLNDLSTWQTFSFENGLLEADNIYPVYVDDEKNIWFSYGVWNTHDYELISETDVAISRIDMNGNIDVWDASSGLESNDLMGIKIINNQLCAYTWGEGLFFFNGENWSHLTSNSIGSNTINKLSVDFDGKLWVASGVMGSSHVSEGTKGVSSYDPQTEIWETFQVETSDINSDNIFSMEIDKDNNKWFGAWYGGSEYGWTDGISILNEEDNDWIFFDHNDGLLNDCISFIGKDKNDDMWVCSYGSSSGGINIVSPEREIISNFKFPNPSEITQPDPLIVSWSENLTFIGSFKSGLRIWNGLDHPNDSVNKWKNVGLDAIGKGCRIYGIVSRDSYLGEETWIASSSGMYVYVRNSDSSGNIDYKWYLLNTKVKREIYDDSGHFVEEELYYSDEERIFGAVPTYPTAVFLDPFDRIWMGSYDNGICIYNPETERYYNMNLGNSEETGNNLLSNHITSFAYSYKTGTLFIGTSAGLNSVDIGIAKDKNTETVLSSPIVYPNPFHPDNGELLRIDNENHLTMPAGNSTCKIFDMSGQLVRELDKDIFELFSWDGNNAINKKCSSGIYFFVISSESGKTQKGKIALIR